MATLDRLGRYDVTEVLGKGAMGVVYRAFDPNIRRTVALKTIRKELIDDDDRAATMLARFKNEAQAAGRLAHPGIVSVYEYGEEGDLAYIAMEYVQGNPLREYFNRGTRFEDRDAVSIMAQLLDALAYAHEQGVYHRDVKPANLIVMTNGRLKVADFGIARIDSSNLTQIGAIMGTPGYMAPEQYAGSDVDWRADVFSAGVVFYQLLTGVKPFAGSAESIAYKVCYETPPTPSEVDPERIQAKYDAVVMRAIAKKPEARFATAQAFRTALLTAYAAPVSPTVSEETVITEIIPTTIRIEPTSPSGHSGHSGQSGPSGQSGQSGQSAPSRSHGSDSSPTPSRTTQPPPGWDSSVLKAVEGHLARFVGPVAKVMIKRAGLQTTDLDALYGILAENLATDAERKQFLATRAKVSSAPAPKAQPGARTGTVEASTLLAARLAGAQLTPELVAAATSKLTTRLGPIAKVVVKKAALQATTAQQFYTLIAESLPTEPERVRFLEELGKS
jgi:serine/threonine-protein kinase